MKKIVCLLALILTGLANPVTGQERLRLATTTSTDNSGLLAVLNPPFEREYNVVLDVIAVGTGKALRLAENGDVDLVLVHAPAAELKLIEDGYGIERQPVMHNDFVFVGAAADPAMLRMAASASDALRRIRKSRSIFVSRGDDSGTHKKELALWRLAKLQPGPPWYLEAGQGMGAVLKIADDKQAYTLADRGTYLAMRHRINLRIVYEGDPELYNPYHVIAVNPARHPHVKHILARRYADYIRGVKGQTIIRNFRVDGEQLFRPDVMN